jgi:hypothetical protein
MASMVSVLYVVNYFTILISLCLGIYMAIEDKGQHKRLKIVDAQASLSILRYAFYSDHINQMWEGYVYCEKVMFIVRMLCLLWEGYVYC